MKTLINQLLLSLFLFLGCYANLDYKRPEVVSVTPAHNSTLIPENSPVVVEFSKEMDTVKTNNEFSLSCSSGDVEGYFTWDNDNKRLTFTPREKLCLAEKYTVRINEEAEDKDGNDLSDVFVSVFYISGENISPYVLSYTPAANSIGNFPNTYLTVTFSEPVNLNTIYRGISISPSVPGLFSWNAGEMDSTVITFTSVYGFEYGVTYTVNIDETIQDINGNQLREPVAFNFTVGDDFIRPTLSVFQDTTPALNFDESMLTHGAEKDKSIVLVFSEVVNTDNLKSAISVTPSAVFYITTVLVGEATTAYLHFTEGLDSEETYTLRISTSINDLQGNSLERDYRFCFVTDGIDSISPVVSSIGDLYPSPEYWALGEIQLLTLQTDPLFYNDIIIDFASGEGGQPVEINPLTLSIYVENIAGSGGEASIINTVWPDVPPVKRFTRLKFGLYRVMAGNTYKIVIKGARSGLKDINGNFMKEDFTQIIKFPL